MRIGYDPPDVIKTDPCAKLECWVDPFAIAKDKAMERIGKNLQQQFENLAATPKTRYKQYLDPPIEDAKKFCTAARKTAKNERTLFYYNGHGVPKPTPSGELWLFNRQYTQYIPISLAEIIGWIGSPAIYVWDCSAAGNIVTKVQEFSAKRDADLVREASAASGQGVGPDGQPINPGPQIPNVPFRDTIQLGACLSHETLPMTPDLPADLFTCCLTSPIEIALRFFLLRNPLKSNLDLDMLLKIPGKLNDRRTPLGELMWIFTAVTDTIAWNTLPRDLFQKLFRHDLVVAALFRGFLLAERIMRFYECTPISVPALPQTHNHPLWDSWDLAVDMCLAQLPTLLEHEQRWLDSLPPQPPALPDQPPPTLPPQPPSPYVHSTFFSEQLTAFEIWLEQGTVAKRRQPEQLPVVLQVLLSQAHRLKALILLCKFLDLGPWAVNVALSIGIFAYVLRLLQAPAVELKPVLIYIWARILAVYENCKEDLLKQAYPASARTADQAPFTYFVSVLHPSSANQLPLPNVSEHRAMCAFILSVCCRDFKPGQVACLRVKVFESCLVHLRDEDPLLRQWAILCIAMLWDDFEEAKGMGVQARVHEVFCNLLHTDPVPEVRAAVMYALGTLLGTTGSSNPAKRFGRSIACSGPASGLSPGEQTDVELGVAMATLKSSSDGSPLVRRELIVLLSSIVNEHQGQFVIAAYRAIVQRVEQANAGVSSSSGIEDRIAAIAASLNAAAESNEGPSNPAFQATMFSCMYQTLTQLTADPQLEIAELAQQVMDYIFDLLFASPLAQTARAVLASATTDVSRPRVQPPPGPGTVEHIYSLPRDAPVAVVKATGDPTPPPTPPVSGFGGTLKRTATAMKSLAHLALEGSGGGSTPSMTPSPGPDHSSRLKPQQANGRESHGSESTPALSASPSTDTLRHLQARSGKPPARPSSKPRATVQTDSAQVNEIISDLVQQDEDRLKKRRQAPSIASAAEDSPDQVFPLKGTFFDFALEYYKESQMRAAEADEPGSLLHNERVWRRQRNEAIIIRTQPMKVPACESGHWQGRSRAEADRVILHCRPITMGRTGRLPGRRRSSASDHFPPVRATSGLFGRQGERHGVRPGTKYAPEPVRERLARQCAHFDSALCERGRRCSPDDCDRCASRTPQILQTSELTRVSTTAADGDVRLFRAYESPEEVKLVSSFQGISEELPRSSNEQDPGLVVEWQQGRGQLLMGGNVKYIRVWDATRETMVQVRSRPPDLRSPGPECELKLPLASVSQDLSTRANSCLTSMTCDQVAGNIVVAGFGDGGLRVYDRRLAPRDNMVRRYTGIHSSWVQNVHMQRGGNRELATAE